MRNSANTTVKARAVGESGDRMGRNVGLTPTVLVEVVYLSMRMVETAAGGQIPEWEDIPVVSREGSVREMERYFCDIVADSGGAVGSDGVGELSDEAVESLTGSIVRASLRGLHPMAALGLFRQPGIVKSLKEAVSEALRAEGCVAEAGQVVKVRSNVNLAPFFFLPVTSYGDMEGDKW